mgnify:CR=1 FL=1
MSGARKTTLGMALRSAFKRNLEEATLYLPDALSPSARTECLILAASDSDFSEGEIAASMGFPEEGLDTQTLEGVALCAAQFRNPPTDELLVESFIYYWRFDAWLPKPGAPESPSPEMSLNDESLQFYDSLGEERRELSCKITGCSRGAILQSLYCRPHHYEMVRKTQCPFSH